MRTPPTAPARRKMTRQFDLRSALTCRAHTFRPPPTSQNAWPPATRSTEGGSKLRIQLTELTVQLTDSIFQQTAIVMAGKVNQRPTTISCYAIDCYCNLRRFNLASRGSWLPTTDCPCSTYASCKLPHARLTHSSNCHENFIGSTLVTFRIGP